MRILGTVNNLFRRLEGSFVFLKPDSGFHESFFVSVIWCSALLYLNIIIVVTGANHNSA